MSSPVSTCGKHPDSIPAAAGIGLRGAYHQAFLDDSPDVAWLEVHSENYMAPDSVAVGALSRIRERYPISLHGVGLSLGSIDPLNSKHLMRLRQLADRIQPGLISEHLSWSSIEGECLHDLLPLPYTEEALSHFVARVDAVQAALGRTIAIENISSYLQFSHSTIKEPEFLAEVAARSGCEILLDINNVYVSAVNHGFCPHEFIDAIPRSRVAEIHLAGHGEQCFDGRTVLVDTHDRAICSEVWDLFRSARPALPDVPVLIEWDAQLPDLDVLLAEARTAQDIMDQDHAIAA
ncbi:MAG: DUF692 domain-containing protein [Rhodothermales bacterium]|nr:DUF692 domain-containing protein [Rhodothermales bacterium]